MLTQAPSARLGPTTPCPDPPLARLIYQAIEFILDKYLPSKAARQPLRSRVFYWLTLLGGLCGSVNNIWNVIMLVKRLEVLKLLKRGGGKK